MPSFKQNHAQTTYGLPMKQITIGYLVPEFPMQTHAFFWREIDELRKLGAIVKIYSTKAPPAGSSKHAFTQEAIAETHYVYPPSIPRSLARLLTSPLGLFRCIVYSLRLEDATMKQKLSTMALIPCAADLVTHARAQDVDHLHIHSCANAAHLGALVHKLSRIAYSATLHGDLPAYGTHHREKLKSAKFVIAVTNLLVTQLRDVANIPAQRIQMCWMGVDTEKFEPHQPRKCVERSGALRAITVARLNKAKGHIHALRAIKAVIAEGVMINYTIIGEGPERSNIEKEIWNLGLQNIVTLKGTQSEEEILQALQNSDVFLLTSIGQGEASPVSVMEAMSCGTPVICSIIGGTPDLITDEIDGFLVGQGAESEIAERLIRLARDPMLRTTIGDAARARAEVSFTARAGAEKLLARIMMPEAA